MSQIWTLTRRALGGPRDETTFADGPRSNMTFTELAFLFLPISFLSLLIGQLLSSACARKTDLRLIPPGCCANVFLHMATWGGKYLPSYPRKIDFVTVDCVVHRTKPLQLPFSTSRRLFIPQCGDQCRIASLDIPCI